MPVNYEVNRRTLRTDMKQNAIVIKLGEYIHEEAANEGVDPVVVDLEMVKYAKICARVTVSAEQLDFELSTPQESAAQVRANFHTFLETAQVEDVDEIVAAIAAADRPPVTPDPNQTGG